VIGEIECREGKYYFKDGDEVVAVFNDDKVCGVKIDASHIPMKQRLYGVYPDGMDKNKPTPNHRCFDHLGYEDMHTFDRTCMVCGRKVTKMEIVSEPKRVLPPCVYPTGKEG